jgi:16S rRNA processing protein RimM
MVVVGRVARTHGLRGHLVVAPETDFVEERFAPGSTLWTRQGAVPATVTIANARLQSGRPVVALEGVDDIDAAAAFVGCEFRVPAEALLPLPEGAHYQHELVGCTVATGEGHEVGQVVRVDAGASGSLLVVQGPRGEVLIPFAAEICVAVDVAARRITVAPPEGLLELNEPSRARPRKARRA